LMPLDVPFYLSKVSINIYSTAGHLINNSSSYH
jgi:hypothetical protein